MTTSTPSERDAGRDARIRYLADQINRRSEDTRGEVQELVIYCVAARDERDQAQRDQAALAQRLEEIDDMASRILDVTVGWDRFGVKCGCAAIAPTYPTYRDNYHVEPCPWAVIETLATELRERLAQLRTPSTSHVHSWQSDGIVKDFGRFGIRHRWCACGLHQESDPETGQWPNGTPSTESGREGESE